MLIKICGLSTPQTIAAAAQAGATHIGLVHYEPSPRHVSLEKGAALRAEVPDGAKTVLLLVDADIQTTEQAIAKVRPDVVQFHGRQTPQWCALVRKQLQLEVWRAIGVRSAQTLTQAVRFEGAVDRLLYDAPPPQAAGALPGGNGVGFDWNMLADRSHPVPWGLAGGLTPANVGAAIHATGAPLVDASSGVESAPGVKDIDSIKAFCQAAQNASKSI
ncbi:MAG: phosphoribosylanthranilate isomerase [Erythrobacter sp.]